MKNSDKRSTEWVKRLPEVVFALNNEVTRLIGKKPAEAIKQKCVYSKPVSLPFLSTRITSVLCLGFGKHWIQPCQSQP